MTEVKALRYNEGKVDWTLLDFNACEPLPRAMMYGAGKYTRENWKNQCDDPKEHLQCAMRHLIAIIQGEEYDLPHNGKDGSFVRHSGHVMANMMMYNFHTSKLPHIISDVKPVDDDTQLSLFKT